MNFLSTGNVWTQVDLDRSSTTLVIGENGAGKSTVLDALCFALFGKPFRKINKPQLVNTVNEKNLLVEVNFTIGKYSYRIVRGIKPSKFEIYKDDVLLNQTASSKDYQKYLEENVIKLNYNSFSQIVILGSSTFIPFMQLPAYARREIIEDLLDIKIFTAMNVLLKEKVQTNKEKLTDVNYHIEMEEEKIEVHQKYIEEIKVKAKERVASLEKEISNAESSITRLERDNELYNKKVTELQESIQDEDRVRKKLNEILSIETKFEDKIKKSKKEIQFYNDNDHCPTCTQTIDVAIKTEKIEQSEKKISEIRVALENLANELSKENQRLLDISEINTEVSEYLEKISDANNQISSLMKYMKQVRKSITETQEEKIDNTDIEEIEKKIAELNNLKEKIINEREVLKVAADLLKDKGIKTQIVRQYVPVMNKLINKYLAAMEFFVSFELDENFEEVIKSRHRDTFSYGSFSEGEKMRIDLALLLTWRAVARMKNSTNTNLLILDEVFDASLDANGCDEFLKLLDEIGKDTNVFVISHKGDILQDKFRSVIRFEKHKNFSRVAA